MEILPIQKTKKGKEKLGKGEEASARRFLCLGPRARTTYSSPYWDDPMRTGDWRRSGPRVFLLNIRTTFSTKRRPGTIYDESRSIRATFWISNRSHRTERTATLFPNRSVRAWKRRNLKTPAWKVGAVCRRARACTSLSLNLNLRFLPAAACLRGWCFFISLRESSSDLFPKTDGRSNVSGNRSSSLREGNFPLPVMVDPLGVNGFFGVEDYFRCSRSLAGLGYLPANREIMHKSRANGIFCWSIKTYFDSSVWKAVYSSPFLALSSVFKLLGSK